MADVPLTTGVGLGRGRHAGQVVLLIGDRGNALVMSPDDATELGSDLCWIAALARENLVSRTDVRPIGDTGPRPTGEREERCRAKPGSRKDGPP